MKKYYAKGGIRTARQVKASEGLDAILRFASEAGYPLFVKPDVGVGAVSSHKIESESDLRFFYSSTQNVSDYVVEEFVTGNICTYDAVIDSRGEPLFESMCVCPPSIADIVNYNLDSTYYVEKHMSENLRFWGRRTVKAFGVQSRFVHLEFFCLDRPHRGLGEKGDFVALEVNMRPAGGYTPDMMNYAHSMDVYQIWADMVTDNRRIQAEAHEDYFCVYAGRRDQFSYVHSPEEISNKYGNAIVMAERMPEMMVPQMGNQCYTVKLKIEAEVHEFIKFVTQRK